MKISVYIAVSLDGYIARPDGALDWLPGADGQPMDGLENEDFGHHHFMETVDALVLGRNTFDFVAQFESWPYTLPVVVLTSRPLNLSKPLPSNVQIENLPPATLIDKLARQGFHHLYIDGGNTIQRFLQANLVHELTLTRVPVLIGQGIPLFGTLSQDICLTHLATKTYSNGFVQSQYRVENYSGNV